MYDTFLVCGLILAVLVNLYSIRAMSLCFLAIGFLLILPKLIPDFIIQTEIWFPIAIWCEIFFGICAISTKAPPANFIAAVCFFNICCHVGGWITYVNDLPFSDSYDFGLKIGESIQILALIISSRPITAIIIQQHRKCLEKEGRHESRFHQLVTGGR